MATFTDDAICLRRIDYSESSQVLTLITRQHGKQSLIAKGIKRSKKGQVALGLDLLELGHISFTRRAQAHDTLGVLTEWRQRDNFAGLRSSLLSLYVAQYAADITPALIEDGDPHPDLFDALVRMLTALSLSQPPMAALVRFQSALLHQIGLMPDLTRCVSCNQPAKLTEPYYLTAGEGGLLCQDCEPARVEKHRLAPHALTAARGPDQGTPAGLLGAFDMFDYYLTETMGRRLKLSAIVRQTAGQSK
jgi:DNA repair protein RecO (recombination protein O)